MGKDQPPDLAALVPSGSIVVPDQPGKQPSLEVPKDANVVSVDNKSKTVSGKVFTDCFIEYLYSCIIN